MALARSRKRAGLAFAVATLLHSASAQTTPPERVDFFELEKRRAEQGLRMTHYDYPAYGETECKTLIDVQAWSPGGQIPFSCLMDRLKRIYLLAQDIWSLGAEARMKQTALSEDPSPITSQDLQLEEGPEETATVEEGSANLPLEERLRAAGRAAQEELLAETASFLEMQSQAAPGQPIAPINIPQIQKLMRGLLFMLREASEMVEKTKSSNGVTGLP